VVGTSLDQGDEIDVLAKLPDDEQRKLADRAKAREKVSAIPPPSRHPRARLPKPTEK
jgi:hypothetical protein